MEQYGSVLLLLAIICALGPPASQYAAAWQHSSAYLARLAPMRRHGLSRAFAGVPRSKRPFLKEWAQMWSSMPVFSFCSPSFAPSGPQQSQYAAARQHSSAYLARLAPIRVHGLSRAFAGVPRSNRQFLKDVCKYAAVWQCPALVHQICALRPQALQYAAALQHSSAI